MEAASKKRGRPKFEEQQITVLRGMGIITAKTNRQAQTWLYYTEATAVLGMIPDPDVPSPFPHLVDWKKGNKGVRGAIKFGVMAEIGRMARQFGAQTAKNFAALINEALAKGQIASAREAELRLRTARKLMLQEHRRHTQSQT